MNLCIDARILTDKMSGLVGYTSNLIQELLAEKDIKLHIIYNKKYHSTLLSLVGDKAVLIPSWYSSQFLSPANYIYEQTVLPLLMRRYSFDIYHNPFGFGFPSYIRVPTLLTIHDVIPLTNFDELSSIQKFVFRTSFSNSLNNAKHIVTISKFTQNELESYYPFTKTIPTSVIYDGFTNLTDQVDHSLTVALQKKLSISKPYIMYIGSATQRKNLDSMVRGFFIAKKRFNLPHQLVLVSKFNRPATLKTKQEIDRITKENSGDDAIVYAGYLEDNEKASLLAGASLFIYPSFYEGFGLPILEALSVGLPVVCSDIDVFREIYNDILIYIQPRDPNSIADGIHDGLTHDTKSPVWKSSVSDLINSFSWNKMKDEYMNVYNTINQLRT